MLRTYKTNWSSSIFLTSCASKLFNRLALNRLSFYLDWKVLFLLPRPAFDLVGHDWLSSFVTIYLGRLPKERPSYCTVWLPSTFLKFSTRSGSACPLDPFLSSDRKAKVLFRGIRSRSFHIRSGVPQGYVLGLALFFLNVDNLARTLSLSWRTKHSLYSDDHLVI